MAKFCEVCNKGIMSGNKVSHSNRKSKRKWAPNVRRVTALVEGSPKKLYVCTRCLRTGNIIREE
jgi:large subunit ribosomal protein L28